VSGENMTVPCRSVGDRWLRKIDGHVRAPCLPSPAHLWDKFGWQLFHGVARPHEVGGLTEYLSCNLLLPMRRAAKELEGGQPEDTGGSAVQDAEKGKKREREGERGGEGGGRRGGGHFFVSSTDGDG